MFTMNVPRTFWSDAIQTAVYLMNKMPSWVLSYKCPLEVLSPNASLFSLPLRTFGCICYVHVPKSDLCKLDLKALKCIFWAMELIRKGISVIILPLDVSLYQEMSCSLNPSLSFLLIDLFKRSKRVKSCPI